MRCQYFSAAGRSAGIRYPDRIEEQLADLLLEKEEVVQQTLLWNPDTGKTEPMRGKEDAHDYRYFPCPDLIPVEIDTQWIEEIREGLPELPEGWVWITLEQLSWGSRYGTSQKCTHDALGPAVLRIRIL